MYRKHCGTYFLRVLLGAPSTPDQKRRKRREVRLSLRTKDLRLARRIAAWANAKLEQAGTMTDRRNILDDIGAEIRHWRIRADGSIEADGPEDGRDLSDFLKRHPLLEQALAGQHVERTTNQLEEVLRARIAQTLAELKPGRGALPEAPPNPLRMSEAVSLYVASGKFAERTGDDKTRLLNRLAAHVARSHPALGATRFSTKSNQRVSTHSPPCSPSGV